MGLLKFRLEFLEKETDRLEKEAEEEEDVGLDPYEQLGVPRNATMSEIKKAFRKEALKVSFRKTKGKERKGKETIRSDQKKWTQYFPR